MKLLQKFVGILLFILPGAVGAFGYVKDGVYIWDALYQAMGMYVLDAGTTENNVWVEVARWTAPLATVSGLFLIVKNLFVQFKNFFVGFSPNAVAVYGNTNMASILKDNLGSVILAGDKAKDVKNHILLFDSEEENLQFYQKNREKLKDKNVYAKLCVIDSVHARVDGVRFFNVDEMVARSFWLHHPLLEACNERTLRVALVGDGAGIQKLLYYGFLNNLYSVRQRIEYHIWGAGDFAHIHADFETLNQDTVTYYTNDATKSLDLIASMDRVVVMQEDATAFLNALTQMTRADVYVFDPEGTFINVFDYEKLYPFGNLHEVLTRDNICTDRLYQMAKQINYTYERKFGSLQGAAVADAEAESERLWNRLSPFAKSSNIAAGDYQKIRLLVMAHRGSYQVDEDICELEHIRWSRFHFLHHWRLGSDVNGKKDKENRLHPCLIPYQDLTVEEKDKDRELIELLLDIEGA